MVVLSLKSAGITGKLFRYDRMPNGDANRTHWLWRFWKYRLSFRRLVIDLHRFCDNFSKKKVEKCSKLEMDTMSYDSDAFNICSSEPSEISFASTNIYIQAADAISWPCASSVNCIKVVYLDKWIYSIDFILHVYQMRYCRVFRKKIK